MLAFSLAVLAVSAGQAQATTVSFTNPGCSTWTVPDGASAVCITATGAAGQAGRRVLSSGSPAVPSGSGGAGGVVSGTLSGLEAGEVLGVCVNQGSSDGGPDPDAGSGGAGGGASGVSLGGDPVLIAGGGGGGDGGRLGADQAGGSAGLPDGVPGQDAIAQPGALGGGGGSQTQGGAGGGGATPCTNCGHSGGGGGGGGSDFCATSLPTVTLSGCAATGDNTSFTTASVVFSYPVTPPAVSIGALANGASYVQGQAVSSSFSCDDRAGGSWLVSCLDQSGHPSGSAVDTSTLGSHTFTVTGATRDGMTGTASVTYQVLLGGGGGVTPVTVVVGSLHVTHHIFYTGKLPRTSRAPPRPGQRSPSRLITRHE